MRGIIGIFGSIKLTELSKMSQSLSHRGNTVVQTRENYGMGQLNNSHSESPFNRSSITVVSDARIDNRSEIFEMIGLSSAHTDISNNELIFAAYSKMGVGFAEILTGDYAIAIVDENHKKIFLIRDHLGVRPLYYSFKQGEYLAFASEPKGLLALGSTSKAINADKLNEYLQWPTDARVYRKETYYQDISSVIPATVLEIDLNLATSRETFYWKINLDRFNHLTSESLIIEACKKSFQRAVQRRLQNVNGVHVSGGLDSSSVYKMAEKLIDRNQLYSIHFYPDHTESDERDFAHQIIQNGLENHAQIDRSPVSVKNLREVHSYLGRPDPSTIPTAIKILPELKYFKSNDVTVVLTGHDGDTVVNTGTSYLIKLISELRIKKFEGYFIKDALTLKGKRSLFITLALRQKYKDRGLFSAVKLLAALSCQQDIPLGEIIHPVTSYAFGLFKKIRSFKKNTPLNKVTANHCVPGTLTGARRDHFSRIYCAGIIELNEILNLSGAAFGIEYAHPFLDKDFIELSLIVPEKMRVGPGGLNRHHFRQAMTGILPEKVRLRQTKVNFNIPIGLNLIEAINTYLNENECREPSKIDWDKIRKELLNAVENQTLSFQTTKKYQRLLFTEIWEHQERL